MTSTSQRWIAAAGGVILLSLAVFLLAVSIAQAAEPSTPLRGGATYTAVTPLRGGAGVAYAAAAPLRGGAAATYVAVAPADSAINAGRGGVFVKTTPAAASTAGIIGGIAVTALVVALIAFLALGSRASRRGELAPVTSLVQSPGASPAMQYDDRDRKAA
jgi:hypothetical protein